MSSRLWKSGASAAAVLDWCRELGAPETVDDAAPGLPAPLLLISQQSRSGGSLLAQLLDGHPQLNGFPYELTIGYPSKIRWPEIDPDQPAERLFPCLFDPAFARFAVEGYRKGTEARPHETGLPFAYAPARHFELFSQALAPAPRSRRDVVDAYLAGFFGAWKRRKPSHAPRFTAAFVPELASRKRSVDDFFADYPDGRLVSIIRHPSDWFVSRAAHTSGGRPRHTDLEEEMRLWNKMASAARDYAASYPDRFFLIAFERLVRDRRRVMEACAEWLGLEWHDCLLAQTFDGEPIAANSNFGHARGAVQRRRRLGPLTRLRIHRLTRDSRQALSDLYAV